MQEWWVAFSCSEAFSRTLTARFRRWKGFLLIGIAPLDVKEERYVLLLVSIRLQGCFWSLTFQAFFLKVVASFLQSLCMCSSRVCVICEAWGLYGQKKLGQHLCIKSWSIMMKRFDLIFMKTCHIWSNHAFLPACSELFWASNLMKIKSWPPASIASKSQFESIPASIA